MKKHLIRSILVVLLTSALLGAATQTISTLPVQNSAFLSTLQSFLREELPARYRLTETPCIISGGIGTTSATLAHTISAIVALPGGYYVTKTATSHTYTASADTYVYIDYDDARTIPAITGAVITRSGNYVFATMSLSSSQPTTPTLTLPLMKVVTGATAITSVTDLRDLYVASSNPITTEAELIAALADSSITSLNITQSFALTANRTITKPIYISPGAPITCTGFVWTETKPHLSMGAYQQFVAVSGEVKFAYGPISVEWFGVDANALSTAITAAFTYGHQIQIHSEITVASPVTISNYVRLVGDSERLSKITIATGGTIIIDTSVTSVYSSLENLWIYTADNTLIPLDIQSATEFKATNCIVQGGLKSVNIDQGIHITFDKCRINNDGAGRYTIYAHSETYINSLIIRDTRLTGQSFFRHGDFPWGHTLEIDGSILEAVSNPVTTIDMVTNLVITASHFEGSVNAVCMLDINLDVAGGVVQGNVFGPDEGTTDSVVTCSGRGVVFQGNYFAHIVDGGAQIELISGSRYNMVGVNWKGKGTIPETTPITVIDNGVGNIVYSTYIKQYDTRIVPLTSGNGLTVRTAGDGHNAALLQGTTGQGVLELLSNGLSKIKLLYSGSSYIFTDALGLGTTTPQGILHLAKEDTHGGFVTKLYSGTATITGTTITIGTAVPAGYRILQVQLHVKTALATGELWNAKLNDGADVETLATGAAVAQNTNINYWCVADSWGTLTDATTNVVITKNGGGAFTTQGVIEVTLLCQGFDTWDSE